jgi:hypothetical protein
MINQSTEKAYDIIIENQRNADTKANIFIVILTGFLAFIGEIPISVIDITAHEVFQQLYLIMIIPLLMFILSLIPIINHKFKVKLKTKEKITLNIFLWKSIVQFNDSDEFISEFMIRYQIEECNQIEKDLLKQIYVNSMILEYKYSAQKFAFFIIIQFILFFLASAVSFLTFGNNPYIALAVLGLFEIAVYFNKQITMISNKIARNVKYWFSKFRKDKSTCDIKK